MTTDDKQAVPAAAPTEGVLARDWPCFGLPHPTRHDVTDGVLPAGTRVRRVERFDPLDGPVWYLDALGLRPAEWSCCRSRVAPVVVL